MDHREATLLLVDYVRGDLDPGQRRVVADHVAAHPDCAETVRFLERLDQDLSRHRERLLGDHPAADALVSYAVGPADELEPVERRSVAAHVQGCPTCFGDLQTVRRVHAELVDGAQASAAAAGGKPRLRGPTALVAALAAGLALGMLGPQLLDGRGSGEPWQGAVPIVRVGATVRQGGVTTVNVPAQAAVVPVVLAWDPWTLPAAQAGTPLVIRVGDAQGERELWRLDTTIGEAWDAPNRVIAFLLPMDRVGAGERLLTAGPADGPPEVTARLSLTLR